MFLTMGILRAGGGEFLTFKTGIPGGPVFDTVGWVTGRASSQ